jgi:hypothetical protein
LAVAEPEADPQTIVYQPYTVPQTVVQPTARIAVTPTMYYSSPKYYTNPMYYINPMYYTNPVYANAASFYSPRMVYQYNNPLVYTSPVVRADEPTNPVVVPEPEKTDDEVKPEVAVDTNTQTKPAATIIPTVNSFPLVPSIYTVPHTYAYTNPIVAPVAYKATPSYYASSAPGVVHQVAKREAEPDSDAQFFYSNYYGYPYAYNSYAYNAYPYRYAAPYAYGYRYL